MIQQSYPATSTISYVASTKQGIDLPKSGFATQYDLMLKVRAATAATVVANQDGLARLIGGITVSASGGQRFLELTDGRQLYWQNYLKQEGELLEDTLYTTASQTAAANGDIYLELLLHWGYDWTNEYDPTIPIPTPRLDNPRLDVTWGSNSSLGTGYTIDADNTEISVTVHELALEPGETEAEKFPDGMISPRIEARTKTIDEIAANLGFERNVPVGDILYETLIMQLDEDGDRSNAELTRMGIKFPKQRRTPWERTWQAMRAATRRKYRIPATLTGVALFPWEEVTRRAVGVDVKMAQEGDIVMGFTSEVESGSLHLVHYMMG